MELASYRTARLVLVPNSSYAEIARVRGRVPPERLAVVRNAPDVDLYRRSAEGVVPERLTVGYVGVMGSQDGIEILIDAWRVVVAQEDMATAILHLVGDGEARPGLEHMVARSGLTENVTFHGYMPPQDFVPILAGCQFTVSPDPPTPFNNVSTMVKVLEFAGHRTPRRRIRPARDTAARGFRSRDRPGAVTGGACGRDDRSASGSEALGGARLGCSPAPG